jgi:hypothetical protein
MNRFHTAAVPTLAAALFAIVAAAVPETACSRRAAPAASTAARPGAPESPGPATPPDDTSPAVARGNLAQRLAAEAAGRPSASASSSAAGPRVEDVATALRRAGVAVTPPSQVLARTIGARYCAATSTPAGLAVAVCEFADEAGAERGLAYSHRTFDRLIPGRTLLRNRSTVLTLSGGASAALAADTTRVSSVFAAL